MYDWEKIIDGNSRLFQVLVLITVASVLLVAAAGINEAGDSNSGVKYTVDGEDNEEYIPAIPIRGSITKPGDSGGERNVDESGGEEANDDGSTTISLNSVLDSVPVPKADGN